MDTIAVVLKEPESLALSRVALSAPGDDDVVVAVEWSGISSGTERLLWSGRMPHFPNMGYPLVPGYESVGRVTQAGLRNRARIGDRVFVPGANCFHDVRCLFGGAAARLVVPAHRALRIDDRIGEQGILLALAATARHAIGSDQPELIIGHGVLGRLVARLVMLAGGAPPTVWEHNPDRRTGDTGYPVIAAADDQRRDYRVICDVSGDAAILDSLIAHLAPGGEIVLAGFYAEPLGFAFPPAFMREARIRVAAQWREGDLLTVREAIESGHLTLDGLITHRQPAEAADTAYRTAFGDPACLKMILDWRGCS